MKTLKILIFSLILIDFLLLGFLMSELTSKTTYIEEKTNITKVIDGDTIETGLGKIRLLGINAPEKKEKYYEEALNFLRQFEGREVVLTRGEENKDKYGRLLRYVLYHKRLLNEEILLNGMAHLYYYEKDKYTERLKKAEEIARKQELGIWQKSENNCSDCISLTQLNEKDPGEYVILFNKCDFNCNLQNWIIKDDASNKKILNFTIKPRENHKISYEGRVWNDDGDTLYLRDNSGLLVLWHRY